MRPYLIFLGLGTSGAGIASLVSYGVRATDLQDSLNSSIEYETEDLESKLQKIREQEEKRRLLEEEEERARIEAERLRQAKIKKSIEELVKEVREILEKDFSTPESKKVLIELKSFWPMWLDNVDNEEFNSKIEEKKVELENIGNTDKFNITYKKMKNLSELWKNFTDKSNNQGQVFRLFQ